MRQFDPKGYLAEVLGPALGSPELPSLYQRYLLDLDDEDDVAIAARLEEVKRYWDKQSEHPRYGPMIRAFREQHAEAKLTLGDAQQRQRVAEEARGREQAEQDARRCAVENWERLLGEVVAAGGLDPARRAQLEKLAARAGIAADVAAAKLDAAPQAAVTEMFDAGVREEIAGRLNALAQSLGEPRVGLSLFHALELGIDAEPGQLARRHKAKVAAINSTAVTNLKEAWMAVLSLVKVHLLDADPATYVNGLAADVREALEPEAFSAFTDGVVDEVEAEHLKRRALELGLTPELAQQVIAELARENGAVVHSGGVVDIVACPSCNFPHPRDAGDERCRKCREALFAACPACGQRNDATSGGCSSCGADLYRYSEATRALRRVDGLLDEGWLAQAQRDVQAALAVLGREDAAATEASRRVDAAVKAAERRWDEAEAARSERRLLTARRLLTELAGSAKDLPGPSGELPGRIREAVGERIDQAEAKFAASRGLEAEAYEQALVEVLRLVADHTDAEHELDRLPPEPPGAVEAVSGGTGMLVRWAPSPTRGVSYAVTRITVPGGVESRVGDADQAQAEDLSAPAGAVVRYAVSAVRGRALSAAVRSAPVVVAPEVGRLRADPGDGEVRLSWTPLAGSGRIVVERRDESGAEPVRIAPDGAGVSDRSVSNGQRYTYTVRVEYAGTDGGLVRTPGQTVFAEPVARPQPLRGLSVQAGADGIRVGFEPPPAGTVVILRCAADPEVGVGSELDPGRLGELGEPLAVEGATAADRRPPAGACFYLPVTVAGSLAIAGAVARHVVLPEVSGTRLSPSGRNVVVTWAWPEAIKLVRVAWRHDRQPSGPEDPSAATVEIGLGEYKDRGGCSIEAGDARSIFVAVFPGIRSEGELLFGASAGKGARATLRNERKTEVRYSVRRVGRLKSKRLEVEISEPAEGALPELVVVGREGSILPSSASDGTVLARLGGDGPRCSTLELRELARPLALRVFLGSASAAGSHVVFDPLVDELMVG